MPSMTDAEQNALANASPLRAKLVNVFASPGEVFEEVVSSPTRIMNWIVPIAMVGISGAVLVQVAATEGRTVEAAIGYVTHSGALAGSGQGRGMAAGMIACTGTVAGTFWSALVLWLMARVFLKTRIQFFKAV